MIAQACSALLAATALLTFPDGRPARRLAAIRPAPEQARAERPTRRWLPLLLAITVGAVAAIASPVAAAPLALAGWWIGRRLLGRSTAKLDPFQLAITWELLAAALRAGLPLAVAIDAVAADLPGPPGDALRATSDLLALGADPVQAWEPALACAQTTALARAARRSARSGAAIAGAATALAEDVRAATETTAEARAQRAAVLVCGPLGLCFLPAFVCLGIVPVVAGLAAGFGAPT